VTALLEVDSVSKAFRGLKAVSGVSMRLEAASMTGLIGPNGAGKTTLFNLIAGTIRPDAGRVLLDGRDITGLRPDQACHAGIARTFQIVRPFGGLSVEENVTVGALRREADPRAARRIAAATIELLGLGGKRHAPAASLTLPERKRLEVARALATGPKLLLLDEAMAGLRPSETEETVSILKRINAETRVAILLIEHVMRAVMALSRHIYVLHHGELIAEGSPNEIVRDRRVIDSYLGEEGAT
jgi:branched-chain amino acid transport system ATP-binding protein